MPRKKDVPLEEREVLTERQAWIKLVSAVAGYAYAGYTLSQFKKDLINDFNWTGSMADCQETEDLARPLYKDPWVMLVEKLEGRSGDPGESMTKFKEDLFADWSKKNHSYAPPDKSNISLAARVAADWWVYQLYPFKRDDVIPPLVKKDFHNCIYDTVVKSLSKWRNESFEIYLGNSWYRETSGEHRLIITESLEHKLGIRPEWLPDYWIRMTVTRENIVVQFDSCMELDNDILVLPTFNWKPL